MKMHHLIKNLVLSFFIVTSAQAEENTASPYLPMYGNVEKTTAMLEADQNFITGILKTGMTREQAAVDATNRGWKLFYKGQRRDAMKRFNQAWLLDPEYGGSYHGFAVLSAEAGKPDNEVEHYFKLSMEQKRKNYLSFTDYGWFLMQNQKYQQAEDIMTLAIEQKPDVRNARSNIALIHYFQRDFKKACRWAIMAQKNGDRLERGFLNDMCSRT